MSTQGAFMDAIIKSRIDLDLKNEVERVLSALGLTVSDAIRMTFKQIAARQGLPFDVKIPNAQTQAAMPMHGLPSCAQAHRLPQRNQLKPCSTDCQSPFKKWQNR
jgi:addiction module RelB/DinJ family antitoxin